MMTSLMAAALGVSILAASPTAADRNAHEYRSAYARSDANGAPLVVLLGADWCPACRVMKNDVMPKVAEAGGLKGVEFSYVDIDREPELAERLIRGNSIPQLVRLEKTERGWTGQHLVGAQKPEKVAAFIQQDLQRARLTLSSHHEGAE